MPQRNSRTVRLVQPTHARGYIKQAPDPELVRRRAIYDALSETGEVIYVIRCDDGLIKIGHTGCLRDRRRQHRADFTAILAVIPGTYEEEQAIHQRFAKHCAKGREYYHPTSEILAFVNDVRTKAGIPTLAA